MKKSNPTKEQLVTMLNLQASMNTKVNPNWLSAGYPFLRAVALEGAEAMEHHGWKWWKHQKRDLPQVQMELVDIWHFMLSAYIVRNNGVLAEAAKEIEEELSIFSESVVFDGITYSPADLDTLTKLEVMIGLATAGRMSVSLFGALLTDCEMDWEILMKRYVGKNVLNFFRQDHGYKDGTYQKMWGGREDNEHLAEILDSIVITEDVLAETLYERLRTRYSARDSR